MLDRSLPFNRSVFILEPIEDIWKPADITIGSKLTIDCETCERKAHDWVVTYLQGGPPAAQTDPDNIWVYQCITCALVDSGCNIVDMNNAEQYDMTDF